MSRLNKKNGIGDIKEALPGFEVSSQKPFNLAYLESVMVVKSTSDTGEEQYRLDLHFTTTEEDVTKRRHFKPSEFPTYEAKGQASLEQLIDWQDGRMVHIYNQFMGAGAHQRDKLGSIPEDIQDEKAAAIAYLFSIEKSFNEGRNGKPIFKDAKDKPIAFWLKLVRQKTDKGYLQFPFPPFMDLYKEGTPTVLSVGPKDILDAPKPVDISGNNNPPIGGGNMPNLPAGFIK